jgi:hypothetical protein
MPDACYPGDSDLNNISRRPRPFPIFYAMQTATGIADRIWSEGQIFSHAHVDNSG